MCSCSTIKQYATVTVFCMQQLSPKAGGPAYKFLSDYMLCHVHSDPTFAGLPFAGKHDSFWTHAGSVDVMNNIFCEKFYELHSQCSLCLVAYEGGSVSAGAELLSGSG